MPGVHVQGCLELSDRDQCDEASEIVTPLITKNAYTQRDGMWRCCRDTDSQQNWSGSDSFQVFGDTNRMVGPKGAQELHPDFVGMKAQNGGEAWDRGAIIITDGWMDEVNGPIQEAWYNLYLRFNGSFTVGNVGVRAHPMLVDTRDTLGTSGNGLVGGATAGPNHGESTFRHRSSNIIDPSANIPWGDGSEERTFGPVKDQDWDSTIEDRSIVVTTVEDGVQDTYHKIDITSIAQAWQAGMPNNGIILMGLNPGDMVGDVVMDGPDPAGLYFHGADARSNLPEYSGFRADSELIGQHRFFPTLHVVVPEPATFGLLSLGGLLALARRRR
jgi:hypothetical protein